MDPKPEPSAFCKIKLALSQTSSYRTAITLYAELWVQGMASDEQPKGEDCASTQYMYILEVMVHEEAEVTDTKSAEPTGHDKDCPYLRTQEDPIMAAERGWSIRGLRWELLVNLGLSRIPIWDLH